MAAATFNAHVGILRLVWRVLRKKAKTERSISSYQLTMRRKFTAMEQMVAQLQAQGSALNSFSY